MTIDSSTANFQQTIKMLLFDKFKTNNPLLDTIITTLLITLFGHVLFYIEKMSDLKWDSVYYTVLHFFIKPSKIIIFGQNSTCPTQYGELYVSSAYSDRFNALLDFMVKHENTSIYEMKELFSNKENTYSDINTTSQAFLVCQARYFTLEPNIYCTIKTEIESQDGEKVKTKLEKITIELFSYSYNVSHLVSYVDTITKNYRTTISNDRITKQFIYSAVKTTLKEDESKYDLWQEQVFQSNRTFENLFLLNKKELEGKIDFFLNHKSWYDEKGIPYNLGIGLYGPPGTGKTSFIKALANKTKRDIVLLPLKMIKTKTELNQLFYETRYNRNNEENSKSFDKKIIVFEDIDCIGDIVKRRDCVNSVTPPSCESENEFIGKLHKALVENQSLSSSSSSVFDPKMFLPDPLTLDDFLNLWDGVRETPGRIIIITSNHYDELDPALVRPGRIDITYEFKNVNHELLEEMYLHFYGNPLPKYMLECIPEYEISTAKVMNHYMCNRDNGMNFLRSLSQTT